MSMLLMNRSRTIDVNGATSSSESDVADDGVDFSSKKEQEEALVALIEHRSKEVEHLKMRVTYYRNQLAEAEKRLQDSQSKLARLQRQDDELSSKRLVNNGTKSLIGLEDLWQRGDDRKHLKEEPESTSLVNAVSTRNVSYPKTELLISNVNPVLSRKKSSHLRRLEESGSKALVNSSPLINLPSSDNIIKNPKVEVPCNSRDLETADQKLQGKKRKFEEKEQEELVQLIGRSSSPSAIKFHTINQFSSQHKRKLRSLSLCPADEEIFVTSALDGMVNLWQLQSNGATASLLSSTDCISPKVRRWPEDLTWHPRAKRLFAVYTADEGDSQVSIIHPRKNQESDFLRRQASHQRCYQLHNIYALERNLLRHGWQ